MLKIIKSFIKTNIIAELSLVIYLLVALSAVFLGVLVPTLIVLILNILLMLIR